MDVACRRRVSRLHREGNVAVDVAAKQRCPLGGSALVRRVEVFALRGSLDVVSGPSWVSFRGDEEFDTQIVRVFLLASSRGQSAAIYGVEAQAPVATPGGQRRRSEKRLGHLLSSGEAERSSPTGARRRASAGDSGTSRIGCFFVGCNRCRAHTDPGRVSPVAVLGRASQRHATLRRLGGDGIARATMCGLPAGGWQPGAGCRSDDPICSRSARPRRRASTCVNRLVGRGPLWRARAAVTAHHQTWSASSGAMALTRCRTTSDVCICGPLYAASPHASVAQSLGGRRSGVRLSADSACLALRATRGMFAL